MNNVEDLLRPLVASYSTLSTIKTNGNKNSKKNKQSHGYGPFDT